MIASGQHRYMDADELCDIAEYYNQHDAPSEQVQAVVDFALQLHPDSTTALAMKARLAMDADDMELAEHIADTIPDQTDREVYFLRAELLLRQQRNDDAFQYLYELRETITEELDFYLLDAANLFVDYHDMTHATPFAVALSECAAEWYRTWELWANICLSTDNFEEAVSYLERMLDADPFDIDAWCMQGEAYTGMRAYDKALEALDYALALDPENYRAQQLRACCIYFLGDTVRAMNIYSDLVSKYGGNEQDYLFMSYCLYDQNKFEEAYEAADNAYHQALASGAPLQNIYEQKAIAASTIGHIDEALALVDLAEALNEEPENQWPYNIYRARIYAENGQIAKALDLIETCKAEDPQNSIRLAFQGALVLFDINCYKEVHDILIEINPDDGSLDAGECKQWYGMMAACCHNAGEHFTAWLYLKGAVDAGTEDIADYFGDFFPMNVPNKEIPDYYYKLVDGNWLDKG